MTHALDTATAAPARWADMDTATRLTAIRALRVQGLTGAAMAQVLGTTRNAILGAAHRGKITIGGNMSSLPIQPDYGRPTTKKARFRVLPDVPASTWAPLESPVSSPTRKQCCWPVGEATGAQQMYCGGARHKGSYCEAHADIAFRHDTTNHIAAENALVAAAMNEAHPGAGPAQAREAARVAFGRREVVAESGDE